MSMTYKFFGRCSECGKFFAMKKLGKKFVRTEDVNVLEVLYQPHLKGTIQTMVERFTPGERKVYEITYVCRFCGEKHTKLIYRNSRK